MGKFLRYKKRPIKAKSDSASEEVPVILVGTYKDKQLAWMKKNGVYNYPIGENDELKADGWGKVKELWLYAGAKAKRHSFSASFIGIKTKDEFLGEYPSYAKLGKSRHSQYAVFKIDYLKYGPRVEGGVAVVRASDFARRTSKLAKLIKQFQDGGDLGLLADSLPSELAKLPREKLRVCEAAVQMDLFYTRQDVIECMYENSIETNVLPKCVYENIDALEFMKGLSTGSVQLVLTSPPYNVGKEYEAKTSIEKYLEWIRPIIEQICRIVSDRGSVCWQVGNYIDDGEVFPLDIYFYNMFKECGMQLRNRVIWHFGHGLHCKNRFSGRYETILWFSKTKDYIFNLDDVRIPSKYPGKRYYKGEKKGQLSGNPLGKNPEDVWTLQKVADDWDELIWDIPNVKSNHPEKVDHPCQFPIELVERCVLALTNKGDVVYDPFAGVGSTMIGALKNGRIGYGTELERRYIEIGQERVSALARGKLKMRPITQEIFAANKAGSLSKIPTEWLMKGYGK